MWRTLTRKYPVDSIGSIEEVAHLFGRTEFAKPGRHGINYESMQFFSDELLEMQRSAQFQNALKLQDGKIEFHVDPADLGRIHVRLPHRDQVIVVPVAPKWRRYATGLSIWHHRCIRKFADTEARGDADALIQAKYDLIQIMKGTALAKRGRLRAAGIVARMEGLFRLARAGDDAATSVKTLDDEVDETDRARTPPEEQSPAQAANDGADEHHLDDNTPTDLTVRRKPRRGYRP